MPKASRAGKASLEDDQRQTDIAVGNRVRQLRRVRGGSLQELAQRAGLSIGFLSQIEKGELEKDHPRATRLIKKVENRNVAYVATLLLSYLVHGPYRDPTGFNFPESRMFPDAGMLPVLFDGNRVSMSFVFVSGGTDSTLS